MKVLLFWGKNYLKWKNLYKHKSQYYHSLSNRTQGTDQKTHRSNSRIRIWLLIIRLYLPILINSWMRKIKMRKYSLVRSSKSVREKWLQHCIIKTVFLKSTIQNSYYHPAEMNFLINSNTSKWPRNIGNWKHKPIGRSKWSIRRRESVNNNKE